MKILSGLVLLISSLSALTVSNEDFLLVRIPDLNTLLKTSERKNAASFAPDFFKIFHAGVAVAPRYTFTNFDRDPSAPYWTFSFGLDLEQLFKIPADRKSAMTSDRARVINAYSETVKNIMSGRKIISRIDTYEELRTNTTDFEKRMLYADKIYDLERELIGLYERSLNNEVEMYAVAGVALNAEGADFNFEISFLKKVFLEEAGRGNSFFRERRYQ